MDRLSKFTNNDYRFMIIWKTRKLQSMFNLKDKNRYPSCVVYKGICSCGVDYIGETEINTKNRWLQHKTPNHNSNPARHIKNHKTHEFNWKIVCHSYRNPRKRKIQEALHIVKEKPKLNEQLEHKTLVLFRNGIT